MKKILTLAAISALSFSLSACGIKALDPKPVPLNGAHLGQMALDPTAMPNSFKVCGTDVSDFKTSLRNGFDYISGHGEVAPVVAPEQATSTLHLDSLEILCLGDKFVKGSIITFNFGFTWEFKDGSKFTQSATIVGASEEGPKEALRSAIENMYNYAFSSYLSKLNLGENYQ